MTSVKPTHDVGAAVGSVRRDEMGRRPSLLEQLRGSLTKQLFNWNEGRFEQDERIPLWVQLLLHIIACTLVLGGTILLISTNILHIPYSIFSKPPATLGFKAECLRWVFFLTSSYAGFVLTNMLAIISVYATFGFYRLRGRETPRKIRDFMNHMLFLRRYSAQFVASVVLWLLANLLFTIPEDELVAQEKLEGKKTTDDAVKQTAKYMTNVMLTRTIREYGMSHSWQFFVNRSTAALMVLAGLILFEKIIIERISSMFYRHAFSERIETNRFGTKTSKKLRTMILQRQPDLAGLELASLLFKGICAQDRTTITRGDLLVYLAAPDADNYFDMLNTELTPELSRDQFIRGVHRLFEEQEDLHSAMLDQSSIIRKLDRLFMALTIWVVVVIWMALFQVSMQAILAALTGIGAVIFAFSEGSIKTAIESIIFVIFTHPFDVGDSLIIKDEGYTVKELGLWSTTFIGPGNRLTYITNSALRSEPIVNMRRSPFQSEIIRVNVLPTTSTEKIRQLETKLQAFLEQNLRDYIPKFKVFNFSLIDKEKMKLEMMLLHRGNFQDDDLKRQRTRKFIFSLKEALTECAIQLSPPETCK